MDLAALNFHVETKALENAITLVDKLGNAVQELGKDVQGLATADKNASAAALLQAKARRENAAALKIESSNAEKASKAADKVAVSTERIGTSASSTEGKVSGVEKVLSRWADKLEIIRSGNLSTSQGLIELGNGFTASQASALAMLKAMGATEDQLKSLSNTLKSYNEISGVNPFDASANGLSRLKKEVLELNRVNELAQKGFNITKEEVRLLSRDIAALEQNYKAAGLSEQDLSTATNRLTKEFVEQAQVRNTLVAQSKAMENAARAEALALGQVGQKLFDLHRLRQEQDQSTYKTQMKEMRDYYTALEVQSQSVTKSTGEMDEAVKLYHKNQQRESAKTAKSLAYVETELSRAENALQGLNNDLHISTSNRLLKFEQQLRQSGMAIADQTVLLDKYKATLAATDKLRTQKGHLPGKTEEDRRVDLLARSLAPQISDVLVSLQAGMNPLTVLMQQGMQVRDLMQLSGVEATKMGEAFKKAGQGMVTTTIAAASAIGSMLIGVIKDAGKSATELGLRLTGTKDKFENLRYQLWLMSKSTNESTVALSVFGQGLLRVVPALVGTAIAAATAAVVAFAVGLYQVIKEENELAKVLALNAGNLNMSQQAAIGYATSFDKVSTSTSKVIDVLNVMAKTGSFARNEVDAVMVSALELQKYADVAIEDTVKAFAKMKDEPVKALLELAKTTGMVPPAVQAAVIELERQGKASEATALAIKTLADVNNQQVQRMKEDYNGFSLFMIDLGAKIAEYFSNIFKDLFRKADPVNAIEKQIAAIDDILNNNAGLFGGVVGGLGIGRGYYEEQRKILQSQLSATVRLRGEEEKVNYINSQNARINAAAHDAYLAALSEEEKHKNKIRDLDKQIAEARMRGLPQAVASFEKLKKFEEESYAKKTKEKKIPRSAEQKAQDSVYNKALKDLEKLRDASMQAEVAARDYSDVQKAALDIMNDQSFAGYYDEARKAWVGYTEEQRIAFANEVELQYKREMAFKEATKAIEAAKQSAKEAFENDAKAFDAAAQYEDQLRSNIGALQDESNELQYQAGLIGLTSSERQKAIEIRKIEIEYAKELKRIEALNPEFTDVNALKDAALEKRNLQLKNLYKKFSNDLNNQLVDSVTDAIMTGLTEGGKAGSKKLRDIVEAELREPVTIFVRAVVQQMVGGIFGNTTTGGGWMQQAMGAVYDYYTQGAGGSSIMGSVVQGISSYWTGASSTYALSSGATGTGLSAGAGGLGASAGGGSIGLTAGSTTTTTASAANTSWMSYAGYAAFIAAAATIASNLYEKGWNKASAGIGPGESKRFGYTQFQSDPSYSRSTALDYSAGKFNYDLVKKLGVISDKWNFIASSYQGFAVAFGRKLGAYGYSAELQNGQVTDTGGFARYKGGLLRSNKTVDVAIDNRDAEKLKLDIERVKESARNMASALGYSTDAIDSYTGSLKVNFKNAETAEEQAARYAEAMNDLYWNMLKSTDGMKMSKEQFKQLREEALKLAESAGYSASSLTDTLVKAMTGQMDQANVGAALGDIIVGSIYNALAMGFAEQITSAITGMIIQPIMTSILAGGTISAAVSQASINAVVQQAQAAINAFNQVISDPAFQSLIGQLNNMTKQITGIAVSPAKNIRSFGSAMLSASEKAKEAAKKIASERFGLQTDLMQALGMTAKLRERELAALDKSNRPIKQLIYNLEDAKNKYDAVVDAAKETLSNLEETRDKIKSIFDLLTDSVRDLRDEVESTSALSVAQASSLISGAISTGVLPDQDQLEKAIDSLRQGLENQAFNSQIDEDRARLLLSNDIESLAKIANKQLTDQQSQILLLETTLKNAEDQLNALLGIQTYSFNTSEAVVALGSALAAYTSAFNNGIGSLVNAVATAPVSSGGGSYSSGSIKQPSTTSSSTTKQWTATGYASKNPDLVAEYSNSRNRKGWPSELSTLDAYLLWHWNNYGKNENRKFATGAAFTNGIVTRPTMFNIGEMGEAGPEAIMPLVNVGGSLGVRAVSGESDNSKQLEILSSAVLTLTVAMNKMQRQIDRARGEDGTSLNVTIVNTTNNPVPVDAI